MKLNEVLCFVLMSVVFCSCRQSSSEIFIQKAVEIDNSNMEHIQLTGQEVPAEVLGAYKLSVCDRWLIVNTSNKNAQLAIVDLDSYEILAETCPEGSAKADFMYPQFGVRQFSQDADSNWLMPVLDNESKMKFVNLNRTVENRHAVIDRTIEYEYEDMAEYSAIISDSSSFDYYGLSYQYETDSYSSPRFVYVVDTLSSEIPVFCAIDEDMKIDYRDYRSMMKLWCYDGQLAISPDHSKAAYVMSMVDNLILFDLDSLSSTTYAFKDGFCYDDLLYARFDDPAFNSRMSITDCFATDECLFLLYSQSERTEDGIEPEKSQVMVIDWNGNCLHSFELDQPYLGSMAYDSRKSVLYLLDPVMEFIYAYDIGRYMTAE